MARYLIESPHTPEECLRALDEVLARGPEELARYEFGCQAGNHTAFAIVDADSRSTVESSIPAFLRSKARVIELNKFTPEQIRSFHRGL